MSIAALGWAIRHDEVVGSEKLTLIALADLADEHDECFPSVEYLSRIVGVKPRMIQRYLQRMIAAGLIERRDRKRSDGSQASSTFVMLRKCTEVQGGVYHSTGGGVLDDTPLPDITTHKKPSPTEKAKKVRKKRQPRRTTIPDGWEPSSSHANLATRYGISLERESEKFQGWAVANGRIFANWNQAFTNWLKQAAEWRGKEVTAKPDPLVKPTTPWGPDGKVSDEFRAWHDQAVADGLIEPLDLTVTRDQTK